jgi:hypothetical protein
MSDETARCMEEILTMHEQILRTPIDAELIELTDADLVPLEANFPEEESIRVATGTIPAAPKKEELPFGADKIEIFAQYTTRQDEQWRNYSIVSSLYLDIPGNMCTSSVTPYLRAYVEQMEKDGHTIPYSTGNAIIQHERGVMDTWYGKEDAAALVKRVQKLMQADNVMPIEQARGTKLPPPVPAYETRAANA